LLIPKLPSPKEEDLSKGILEAIDLDSYRAEIKQTMSIILEGEAEYMLLTHAPTGSGGGISRARNGPIK
jgi:type I restriction enzyme R subunit